MSPLGNPLLRALIATQSDCVGRLRLLQGPWGDSFLPYALISLPLVLVTLLDWWLLIPVVLLFCLWVMFQYARDRDSALFRVVQPDSHWLYMMPMCFFSSVWCILMFVSGAVRCMNVVTAYVLLLLYLMLPVVRFGRASKRKARWLPFSSMFYGLAGFIFMQWCWGAL